VHPHRPGRTVAEEDAGVPIEIDVPADPARMARLTRAVLGRSFLRYRVVGAIVVVLAVASLALGGAVPLAVGLAAGGLALIVLPLLAGRRAPTRQLVDGAWHYSIDQRGVVARSPTVTNSLTWDAFVRAQVTPSDVLLFVAKRSLIGIPRASLPPAAEAELTRLLTARGLLAPAQR
jgi:hypothetical protein